MKYHIAAVSRMTNLSVDVIRSWERRYGIVEPGRDEGGLRLYSDEDVARLTLARTATQLGHPIRRVAKMSNEELEALAGQNGSSSAPYADVVERVIGALHSHDPQLAEQVLSSAALLVPARTLVLDILAPVLRSIGAQWENGRVAVWQEHLLSILIRNTAGAMRRSTLSGHPIVFATPPFDLHEFGITLAALLASTHGRRTINLGTGVPPDQLVQAVNRLNARAAVVGMTSHSIPVASAIEYVERIDRDAPPNVGIWLGGALGVEVAQRLDLPRVRGIPTLEAFDQAAQTL